MNDNDNAILSISVPSREVTLQNEIRKRCLHSFIYMNNQNVHCNCEEIANQRFYLVGKYFSIRMWETPRNCKETWFIYHLFWGEKMLKNCVIFLFY